MWPFRKLDERVKLCVDCKHVIWNERNPRLSMCGRPLSRNHWWVDSDYLVTGAKERPGPFCANERNFDSFELSCSTKGHYWEPKE